MPFPPRIAMLQKHILSFLNDYFKDFLKDVLVGMFFLPDNSFNKCPLADYHCLLKWIVLNEQFINACI